MNAFETEPAPSKENESQNETLFTKDDFLVGIVSYIEQLWTQRAIAVQNQDSDGLAHLRDELYRAYRELEECRADIDDPSVTVETRTAVENELWMAKNHLYKVLR
jgi:hypothetical protein